MVGKPLFQSFIRSSWTKRIITIVMLYHFIWFITVLTPNTRDSTEPIISLEKMVSEEMLSEEMSPEDMSPESIKLDKNKDFIKMLEHDEKVNIKYCGKKNCNFMFPYFIPEQETRANIHLRSLTYLARSLNRIMVLPNVGNSKMSSCLPYSFEFYYNLDKMKEMFPDVKFITQSIFKNWTNELLIKPDTLHTWFIEDGRNDSYSIRDHELMAMELSETYSKNLLINLCLDQFNLKISNYTEFHTGMKNLRDLEHKMANFFTENLKDTKSPVILIRNRSRKQMFPLIEEPIPYASHIMNQASEIINKLQPYFCIHWRMEQGIPEEMPRCAKNLINKINRLNETEGISKVYLATDYPISGGKAASQTFYDVGRYHKKAINMINSTLDLNTWVSLGAFKEFRDDETYVSEFNGSGIHGILDKLICTQSDYFLSGPIGCCRIRSTFTRLIGETRRNLRSNGVKRIRNVITRW